LANRIYRNLTGTLSGTQEYMATEKLYELVEEGGFDVVVVDTPPSRHALDFLDAPRRFTNFLDNRLFRVLMVPTRASLKIMGFAAHALLRTISKVAGADIVSDAVTFFQAFEGMEDGFRNRAARVRELLTQSGTAFVLVASPRLDSVDDAVHFAEKLIQADMPVAALVVNRVQPRFLGTDRLDDLAGMDLPPGSALSSLVENLRGYAAAAGRDEQACADLVSRVAPAPVVRVPLLNSDVHDLRGLEEIADLLFEPPRRAG
jgi:anion-transporting  ArsA/GET3 family ATPase